jgi:hypothetical protein
MRTCALSMLRLAYALRFAVRRFTVDTAARSTNRTDLADPDSEQAGRQVEASAQVLLRDHVRELHELGLVEVLAQFGEERVGHPSRGIGDGRGDGWCKRTGHSATDWA